VIWISLFIHPNVRQVIDSKEPTSQADLRRINTIQLRHKDKKLMKEGLLDQPEE